jgi:hypothetical protein
MTSAKGEEQLVRRSAKNLSVPFARRASDGTYETSAEDEIGRCVVAPWGEITKCRGTLRAVVGRALDTELLEPAPQGVGGAGTGPRGATDLIHTVRRMTSSNPM